jgi:putative hydrolase of the HAD superfamily
MKINSIFSEHTKPLLPIPTHFKQGGKLSFPIKCVLFDIYGTLFISGTGDIGLAQKSEAPSTRLQTLLLKYDISTPPEPLLKSFFEAIEKQHDSLRIKGVDFPEVKIEKIWSSVLQNDDLETVKRFALEFELLKNPVYPMPHLKEVLNACNIQNILMGIVSNAQFYTSFLFRWFLKSDMALLGFSSDLIFMSYQMEYAKPSEHLYKTAVKNLSVVGINPNEVLFVGNDMRNDIYPANRVGFQTGLFAGDARSLRLRKEDPLCKNLKANLIITDLRQILDLLKNNR